ncbi:hypothetical protein [Flavobacterium sp.]|uniref:hypothetical protein n=1 Tax=Flavobacterium sp. TaxID=239 RepID=UPI0026099EBE|nr:hypothetical protein [Flavobacterium sp.]
MRINYNKIMLTMLLFAVSFASFAQLPDPDGPGTGDQDPPAPINTKIIYLALVAVAFAFFYMRRSKAAKA